MRSGFSEEVLFVAGGKVPERSVSSTGLSSRRMGLNDATYRGLWGYVPSLNSWRQFGGDPLSWPFHPLRNVEDAKFVYVPRPHEVLLAMGGYDVSTGTVLDRVYAYSFLTGMWEGWPPMLRKRRGVEFHAVFVSGGGGSGDDSGVGAARNPRVVVVGRACKCDVHSHPILGCYREEKFGFTLNNAQRGWGGTNRRQQLSSPAEVGGGGAGAGAGGCGECDLLFVNDKNWMRSKSRAPSCPPQDGGAAVMDGRYVYLPSTAPPTAAAAEADVAYSVTNHDLVG